MSESPFAISNYFIHKANEEGRAITPMQAIKLIYIAHGWHLGLTGAPLISEPVEAWKYGPVVESVYHAYKKFGSGVLEGDIPVSDAALQNSNRLTTFLDSVWSSYSKFSGGQLSTLTHQEGTPWHKIWIQHNGCSQLNAKIPNTIIEEHYKSKTNEGR